MLFNFQVPSIGLTEAQVLLISLIAVVLAQTIKLACAWIKKPIPRDAVTIIAFVVSIILSYLWVAPSFALATDPMQAAVTLLEKASAVLGVATLVYNVILEKIFSKLGLDKENVERYLNRKE